MIPLEAFGVGTGVARLALEVAALPLPGGVCVRGDWFPWSRVWQISLVFTHCFWLAGLVLVCACIFSEGGVAIPWLAWAFWG